MKKAIKVLGVVAVAGAGLYAANYYRQYRKFKQMEEKIEHLPLHAVHKQLGEIHSDHDKVVVEMPKRAGWLARLQMCLRVLCA